MPTTVIIGASRGVGYQLVRTLTTKGHTVIATARDVPGLESKLQADNIANAHIVEADLTSHASLQAAAKTTSTLTSVDSIDHLIINGAYLSASTPGLNPTDFTQKPDLFLEELNKSNEANVAGPLFTINAFLPLLRKGTEKKITYISSGVADLGETIRSRIANSVPYSVSKAAGNLVISKFAAELKDEGFTCLSVGLGAVDTGALSMDAFSDQEKAVFGTMFARMQANYPEWKGPISPEECADRILKVAEGATVEQNGQFLSYWGNTTQWL